MTKDETIEPSLAESRSLAKALERLQIVSVEIDNIYLSEAINELVWSLLREGGVTSPDYVMVPREPTKEMLIAAGTVDGFDAEAVPEADNAHIAWWKIMLSAAPPSPRSDDGSGLTPSEHGSSAIRLSPDEVIEEVTTVFYDALSDNKLGDPSDDWVADFITRLSERLAMPLTTSTQSISEGASPEAVNPSALRAQVIEECAKVADNYARDGRVYKEYACETADEIAARIRSLSAVSAIAQERDVGKPVAWRWRQAESSTWVHWGRKPTADDFDVQNAIQDGSIIVEPLYLHPTTSPSAISEAPASADAVSRQHPSVSIAAVKSWQEEIARLREALRELLNVPELADIDPEDRSEECWAAESKARSALPASDEK